MMAKAFAQTASGLVKGQVPSPAQMVTCSYRSSMYIQTKEYCTAHHLVLVPGKREATCPECLQDFPWPT